MADPPTNHRFPTDDALCEQCGYPLRGLTSDAACPECGLAVMESSPAKRTGVSPSRSNVIVIGGEIFFAFLYQPRRSFLLMQMQGSNWPARCFLMMNCLLVTGFWSQWHPSVMLVNPFTKPWHQILSVTYLLPFLVVILTYLEMIGVTAFSKRRGWRVPFHVAERVCCYASVGWLPGVLIAAIGFWLLQTHAVGRPWFEQMLGLVRVAWLFYAALFLLSLLWFETLVWIGVRQVKYANAWPETTNPRTPD